MTLIERDTTRKQLVQYFARVLSAGATEKRSRELLAVKARALGATDEMIAAVVAQVEGES